MKNRFAKIIELQSHQVLVVLGWDSESEKDIVSVTTKLDGFMPEMTMGFGSEADAAKCFAEYGEEQAQQFLNRMSEMMNP